MRVAVQSALLTLLGVALLPARAQEAQVAAVAAAAGAPALGEIVVQAKRDDPASTRKGTTTVIGAEQIERNNAVDMANIARYSPLISVPGAASGSGNVWDGAGNTGFNIRGVEGNRVSMELDGISLPDAAPKPDGNTMNAFGIGRDYFDPETFHYVSIGSGASPAGSGTPGLGGSVSFVTKSPEQYLDGTRKVYGEYKFGYSGEQNARMHAFTAATEISPSLKALVVGVHRQGDELDSKSSVPVNPDDWESNAILAKLNWQVAPGHKLGFTIDSYKADHHRVYNNKTGALYPQGAIQDSTTKRNRYSIEHNWTDAGLALFDSLKTHVYKQDASVVDQTNAAYVSGGQPYLRFIETGYYNDSRGLVIEASKKLGTASSLFYGANYETQESRRPWYEDRTVVRTGAHQITRKNRMADMDTDKVAAYVRGEFGFPLAGHQATLTPGLRAEHRKLTPKNLQNYAIAIPNAASEVKEESDSYFTPSLNLSVELTPTLTTYAQYSRGTRLPSSAERTGTYDSFSYTGAGVGYAVLGNANLQKETSNAFELGLKGTATPGVEFSASMFYTRYNNFIEYATQPADPVNFPTITFGLFRPENIGKARIWGGEFSSNFHLGQWLQGMKGYSVNLAAGLSRGNAENQLTGQKGALVSVQPYKANATFAWDDPAKRGGAAFIVSGVRSQRAGNDVIGGVTAERFLTPGYGVMDFTAYWNISKHVELSAGAYNLGDKKYWDFASARGLPGGTTVATRDDIERMARPGRNYAFTLKVIY
ncbi:TonB-dependent receptor [Duganella sp. Leaf61]|nr:TonB-dependent receptor [Duganella sp. Leaf61]